MSNKCSKYCSSLVVVASGLYQQCCLSRSVNEGNISPRSVGVRRRLCMCEKLAVASGGHLGSIFTRCPGGRHRSALRDATCIDVLRSRHCAAHQHTGMPSHLQARSRLLQLCASPPLIIIIDTLPARPPVSPSAETCSSTACPPVSSSMPDDRLGLALPAVRGRPGLAQSVLRIVAAG